MRFPSRLPLLFGLIAGAASGQTLTWNFDFSVAGVPQVSFQAVGSTTFTPAAAGGYGITIENSSIAGLDGLHGWLGGPLTVGAFQPGPGGSQVAPISGAGELVILGGSQPDFEDSVLWDGGTAFSPGGSFNPAALPNIDDISYSGPAAALQALATGSNGKSLSTFLQLVPEPSTYAALLGAAALLWAIFQRRTLKGRTGLAT